MQTTTSLPQGEYAPVKRRLRLNWPRGLVVTLAALAIFTPLLLIVYQSFLSAPFFAPVKQLTLDSYRFIFDDPDFRQAFVNGFTLATGLTLIAVPMGGMLAFLMVRTDLPGRNWIAPALLVPIFVSPMVIGFGYVVSMGPVGFYTVWAKELLSFFGFDGEPWNIYSFTSIVIIAGLTHVPHVYLYASSALKSLGSDVEEAARVAGASPLQVALNVSLPMIMPALAFAGVLVFFLGFEVFGLVLVLGDPEGHLVLPTYLYKLTNKLGTPSYHLMAAVAVCLVAVTMPLVMLQRWLLRSANKYVAIKGKGSRQKPLPLGKWRWVAFALIAAWLLFTVVIPLSGIALRTFVSHWGLGVHLFDVLTLQNLRDVWDQPSLVRGIINTVAIGVIGGAFAVVCYTAIALAMHRKPDGITRFLDYSVLVPRAVPGLLAGLSFLWVFLFVPSLLESLFKGSDNFFALWMVDSFIPAMRSLRSTIFSVWLAYTVVWLAYGLRLINAALLQVGPELEEAARAVGAPRARVTRDVTIPLVRYGLIGAWLMVFLIFEREYSTGVYLLSPGTEVIGSLIVSMWAAGAVDLVAALSFINITLVAVGLGIALRFGVKLHD
ncbi:MULTISPECIES: iron ABC transporter permease [unclassified Herbaspirillum]|uniref:ABC transporter permease n=1 Tax=unclassified Herbaspirillum TaxID=2624150 RepID=UPI00114EF319|nr:MULTISPECIES: iron ABC transporter permease [unclassified Herbaspirillum]MBB5390027.1 iron(III) transport system permease protein [Herbaspirillum sp. SJZ102]TQK09471.1 iron(III) transport system permease protein [Herbaspirillum sp. SJZ130]TQK13842.1 iron(III) transport system permease protein [Herbaspirillum sp. SJZ106]TWC69565.1 iron(III) transport system permease protein [Herbaspirillum sp. SJZ099]